MSAAKSPMAKVAPAMIAALVSIVASAQEAVQQQYVQQAALQQQVAVQGAVYDDVAQPAEMADTPVQELVPEDPVAPDVAPLPVDATAVAVARAQEEARLEAAAQEREEAERKAEAALDSRRIYTRVFRLSHANAEEVAERFNATWSGEFGTMWKISRIATSFPEANAVMVTAPKRILEACERVVDEIDREAQQVYIEARFVELGNIASHKLGIDWSMLDGMSGSANLGGGLQSTRLGSGVTSYQRSNVSKNSSESYSLSGRSTSTYYDVNNNPVVATSGGPDGSVAYFNGTLNFSEMSLTLRALESSEDARVFSNPKIIVSSGKKATVDMTTKYPNVLVSAKRTLNGNAESLDLATQMMAIPGEDKFLFAREAFFSWGIQLDVIPRIGTNGLINVTIVPTISDIDQSYGSGGFVMVEGDSSEAGYSAKYPIIKVQRLVTEFNMASGTTAVIGGLSRTVESQQDRGIPWLRTWPWIGPKLFGSKVRVKEQREIIVFVTVGLVEPKRMSKDAGLPKNAVLGRQYVKEQKLEPGDRPEKNMEGLESLDMRPLEEQARDPLKTMKKDESALSSLKEYIQFKNDGKPTPSSEESSPKPRSDAAEESKESSSQGA